MSYIGETRAYRRMARQLEAEMSRLLEMPDDGKRDDDIAVLQAEIEACTHEAMLAWQMARFDEGEAD